MFLCVLSTLNSPPPHSMFLDLIHQGARQVYGRNSAKDPHGTKWMSSSYGKIFVRWTRNMNNPKEDIPGESKEKTGKKAIPYCVSVCHCLLWS